jgi:hypothetical protein
MRALDDEEDLVKFNESDDFSHAAEDQEWNQWAEELRCVEF